jgi:hypothetical protein
LTSGRCSSSLLGLGGGVGFEKKTTKDATPATHLATVPSVISGFQYSSTRTDKQRYLYELW